MRRSPDDHAAVPDSAPSRRSFLAAACLSVAAAYRDVLAEEPMPPVFDGAAHVVVPDFHYIGATPITVEARVVPDRLDRDMTVVGDMHGGGFGVRLQDAYWEAVCHNGERYMCARSDAKAVRGTAVELMAVMDQQGMRLYVDGVLQRDIEPWKGRYRPSEQSLMIGADPDGGNEAQHLFQGAIDHVRLSGVAIDTHPAWRRLDRAKIARHHLLFLDDCTDGRLQDLSPYRFQTLLKREDRD